MQLRGYTAVKMYTTSGYNIALGMFPDGPCAPEEEM